MNSESRTSRWELLVADLGPPVFAATLRPDAQRGALDAGRVVRIDVTRDGFGSGDVRMRVVSAEEVWLPLHAHGLTDYVVVPHPVPSSLRGELADFAWESWSDVPCLPSQAPPAPPRPLSPGPLLEEVTHLAPGYARAAAALNGPARRDLAVHWRLLADVLADAVVANDLYVPRSIFRAIDRLCPTGPAGTSGPEGDLLDAILGVFHVRGLDRATVEPLMPAGLRGVWSQAVDARDFPPHDGHG